MKALVLEARGLPAGFLGCYGNEWVATPCLDRLAAEGVVFDQHIADCPGYQAPGGPTSSAAQHVACVSISKLHGFAETALEAWHGCTGPTLWIDGPTLAPPWRLPGDILASYCEDAGYEPWADPPDGIVPAWSVEEANRLYDTFAAVVTYFDAQMEELLEGIRAGGDQPLICVTARCGLALGEHRLIGPARAWLHEEVVHLPLVMRLPESENAGLRLWALTQPTDLLPTVLELLGRPALPSAAHSLGALLRQEADAVRPYACSSLEVGESSERLLRTLDWALLVPRGVPPGDAPRLPQLYVKPDDRCEVNDVRQTHLDLAEGMEATLQAYFEQNRAGGPPVYPPLPEGF